MTPLRIYLPRYPWMLWLQFAALAATALLLILPLPWYAQGLLLVSMLVVAWRLLHSFRPHLLQLGSQGQVALITNPGQELVAVELCAYARRLGVLTLLTLKLPGAGRRQLLLAPGIISWRQLHQLHAWLQVSSPPMDGVRGP